VYPGQAVLPSDRADWLIGAGLYGSAAPSAAAAPRAFLAGTLDEARPPPPPKP